MWAFFSRRLRMWLLFVVGLPLIVRVLRSVADTLEQRRGPSSRIVSAVRSAGDLADKARGGRRRRRRGLFR